jgi:DNA polymerase delta subunit 2
MSGSAGDSLALDLLMEFLLGESTSPSLQAAASQITRLIVAGNSIAEGNLQPDAVNPSAAPNNRKATHASNKKYGYDSSAYNPAPTAQLDLFLATLLPSLPVTLLPGASDPANVSIPQQPLHPALFPKSRAYASPPVQALQSDAAPARKPRKTANSYPLHPTTNPAFFTVGSNLFLGTSGQPTDDISKYISSTPNSAPSAPAETTLDLMEATLRWRLIAPTAPDTLWCYPYQNSEPFVLDEGWCPSVYFVGNQEAFGTRLVQGEEGQVVRCVSVPRFSETGEVVIVDLATKDVTIVKFQVEGSNSAIVNEEEEGKAFFDGV